LLAAAETEPSVLVTRLNGETYGGAGWSGEGVGSEDDVLAHPDAPVDARAVVIPGPDGVDAQVVWTGLPCQTAPSVEVTRDQERVVVAVARGPEVLGGADTCPDNEDFFAVDLVLAGDDGVEQVEAHVR
jgi:hypothetical protein